MLKIRRICGIRLGGRNLNVCYNRMNSNIDCKDGCAFLRRIVEGEEKK